MLQSQDTTLGAFPKLVLCPPWHWQEGGKRGGGGGGREKGKKKKKERRFRAFEVFPPAFFLLLLIIPSPMRFWGINTYFFPWRHTLIWPLFHHHPPPAFCSIFNLSKSWNLSPSIHKSWPDREVSHLAAVCMVGHTPWIIRRNICHSLPTDCGEKTLQLFFLLLKCLLSTPSFSGAYDLRTMNPFTPHRGGISLCAHEGRGDSVSPS